MTTDDNYVLVESTIQGSAPVCLFVCSLFIVAANNSILAAMPSGWYFLLVATWIPRLNPHYTDSLKKWYSSICELTYCSIINPLL
jgi:hypothetical protein